jgi:hypothetical protein
MYRGADGARRQGELLRKLGPDLILLQEVNLGSAEILRQAAGADWMFCIVWASGAPRFGARCGLANGCPCRGLSLSERRRRFRPVS